MKAKSLKALVVLALGLDIVSGSVLAQQDSGGYLIDVTADIKLVESQSAVFFLPFFPPLPFVTYNKIQYAHQEYIVYREGILGTGKAEVELNRTLVRRIAKRGVMYWIYAFPLFGAIFGLPVGHLAKRKNRSGWIWGLTFGGAVTAGYIITFVMIARGASLLGDTMASVGAAIASLAFWCWVGGIIFLWFATKTQPKTTS